MCSCVSVVKRPEIASPDAGSLCHGGPAHGAHGLLNGHHGLYDAGHERSDIRDADRGAVRGRPAP